MPEFRGIPNELQMCYGKEPFESYADARQSLTRIARNKRRFFQRSKGRGRIEPYRCLFCQKFHIGHGIITVQSKVKQKFLITEEE